MSALIRSTRLAVAASRRAFHSTAACRAEASAPTSKRSEASGPMVNLRFVTANEVLFAKPVYMCTIPAASGVMGVLGDHAPTIAQLKPGVVTIHGADVADVVGRYFISGGFATIKSDSSATVTVAEAIALENLDATLARKALDDANAALSKASTDKEKAEFQVVVEVQEAILQSLEAKL